MSFEDRIREELRREAGAAEPPGWGSVRARAAARRRRRQVVAYPLAAIAAVIAIVAGGVTVASLRDDNGGGNNEIVAGPGTEQARGQIVAVTEDGRVIVIEPITGAELAVVATDADADSTVTVAPDGSRVLFDRASPAPECSSSREIVSVPLAGGEPQLVATGASQPAVSPDGRMLAYLGHSGPSGCGVAQSLVVQPVDAPTSGREWTLEGGEAEYLDGLSWAPDSRNLAFGVVGSEFPRILDTETGQSIDDARRLALPPNTGWFGYLGATGDFLGTRIPDGYGVTDDTFSVVALDEAGGFMRELFSAAGTISEPVVADASGTSILIRTGPDSDSESLHRWSDGEPGLTELRAGVVSAAWVTAVSLPERAPAPGPPAEIVAATSDGRLVVLDAATGAEMRTLAASASGGIAVSPDGDRVYFTRPSTAVSDPPTELVTVPTRGGDVRRLVGGAHSPAVSPDGRLLAFVTDNSRGIRVVEIPDDFDGWIPNVVGDGTIVGPATAVITLSWAPDSRHLLYTVVGTPEGSPPRVAEIEYGMVLDEAPHVPLSSGCAVAFFRGAIDEIIGVNRGRVIVLDPGSGEEVRELFRGPDLACDQVLASDHSGRRVLYAGLAGAQSLYTWSEGDPEPTWLTDGVLAAAWLPARP